jgi:hypothetical protein
LKVTEVQVPVICTEPEPSLPTAYVLEPTTVPLDRVIAGAPSSRAVSPLARSHAAPSVVTWKLPRLDLSGAL